MPFQVHPVLGVFPGSLFWIIPTQRVVPPRCGVTQSCSVWLSISPSAPDQPAHAERAVSRTTEAEHRTQQFPPHRNMVAVPPVQLSPEVLHGRGIASTSASEIASGAGGR